MSDHLVVAGNGMVGQRFVEALRDRDGERRWRVTVLAEEPRRAYDRVNLSSYFDGAAPADLDLVPGGCYAVDGYELHLSETVTAIDRAGRTVATSRGRTLGYDALVLATGSSPFVPPVPGADLPGCFVYRTLDDLDAIAAAARRAAATTRGRRSGLVVGGGLLGLEAARALRLLGMSPHVVELAPRLMPQQVDEGGGALLREMVEQLGVTVRLGVAVREIARDGVGVERCIGGPTVHSRTETCSGLLLRRFGLLAFKCADFDVKFFLHLGEALQLKSPFRAGFRIVGKCTLCALHMVVCRQ